MARQVTPHGQQISQHRVTSERDDREMLVGIAPAILCLTSNFIFRAQATQLHAMFKTIAITLCIALSTSSTRHVAAVEASAAVAFVEADVVAIPENIKPFENSTHAIEFLNDSEKRVGLPKRIRFPRHVLDEKPVLVDNVTRMQEVVGAFECALVAEYEGAEREILNLDELIYLRT